MKTYFAKQLFDGQYMHHNMHMQIDHGRIVNIISASQSTAKAQVKLDGLVCAGFIDLQVNGGGGVLFNYEQNPEALLKIFSGHAQYGTTAMLPTLITDSSDKMKLAADAISRAIAQSMPGIVGVHFEGPHLSLTKNGIHPSHQVRPIDDVDLATITRKDLGKVLVTIAPENLSPDVIRDLVAQGLVVSLGHSGADIDTVLEAIDAGAHCFTHLYNAMSGLSARAPGMIGAALADSRISAGIIADMHHVHPLNLKLAYQCLGPKRLMLVTDAMAHVGCDMHTLPWLNSTITKVGSKLTLDDGSLAGSCLDMASGVRNMYQSLIQGSEQGSVQAEKIPHQLLMDVLNMASQTPANVMGLSERGSLKAGYYADFVLLNDNLETQACWVGGKQVAGAALAEL